MGTLSMIAESWCKIRRPASDFLAKRDQYCARFGVNRIQISGLKALKQQSGVTI
ncbi:MAG: hypothetical protein ACI9ND_000087 [Yoonia sp.]|jgi:hypothetical protein